MVAKSSDIFVQLSQCFEHVQSKNEVTMFEVRKIGQDRGVKNLLTDRKDTTFIFSSKSATDFKNAQEYLYITTIFLVMIVIPVIHFSLFLQCKFLYLNNSKSSGIQEGARTYYGSLSQIDVKRIPFDWLSLGTH